MATVAMVTSDIRMLAWGEYFAPSYYPYGQQPVQNDGNQFDAGQYDNRGSYVEYIPGVGEFAKILLAYMLLSMIPIACTSAAGRS